MASLVRFTNCVLASEGEETRADLYIDEVSGKIVAAPAEASSAPAKTVDLRGRLLSPGLIDVQLNGCMGINFSGAAVDMARGGRGDGSASADYAAVVQKALTGLLATGVTSFLPTLTTAPREVFHQAIPYYGPSGHRRDPALGSESLGIHCEGPFLAPAKRGAHDPACLLTPAAAAGGDGADTIEAFYGRENLARPASSSDDDDDDDDGPAPAATGPAIRALTLAPELPGMLDAMRALVRRHGTVIAMGHSAATYEQGLAGLQAGATMLTHTFNAMEPCLHRSPGLVGLVGAPLGDAPARPFFGLIADAIHVHPSCARAAWATHEHGCILTTDGTAATGLDLPDGPHQWYDRRVVKAGRKLYLEGTDTIAGGTTTLVQCVANLVRWTGISVARALRTVTSNPARMLGVAGVKGTLQPGADADLVVLSWDEDEKEGGGGGQQELRVHQVWKFGRPVVGWSWAGQ